eukprot:179287-Chlamydomonas_euryale.AAC.3
MHFINGMGWLRTSRSGVPYVTAFYQPAVLSRHAALSTSMPLVGPLLVTLTLSAARQRYAAVVKRCSLIHAASFRITHHEGDNEDSLAKHADLHTAVWSMNKVARRLSEQLQELVMEASVSTCIVYICDAVRTYGRTRL